MKYAAAVLLLLQEPPPALEGRILLPPPAELEAWGAKGPLHRRAVDLIADRGNWEEGFRKIRRKLGLETAGSEVTIRITEAEGPAAATGGGTEGVGIVTFNMSRMVEYGRLLEEYAAAEREGKRVTWVVPPSRLEDLIHHELVHVFTGTFREEWLTEGVAAYVAGDESVLYSFAHRGGAVGPIDGAVPREDAYARGWAFLAWLEETGGPGAAGRFVRGTMRNRGAAGKAAEAAAGKGWKEIAAEEQEWSRAFLAGYRRSR